MCWLYSLLLKDKHWCISRQALFSLPNCNLILTGNANRTTWLWCLHRMRWRYISICHDKSGWHADLRILGTPNSIGFSSRSSLFFVVFFILSINIYSILTCYTQNLTFNVGEQNVCKIATYISFFIIFILICHYLAILHHSVWTSLTIVATPIFPCRYSKQYRSVGMHWFL